MRSFRARLFLAAFGVAAAMLILASTLVTVSLRRQTYEHIERSLVTQARLMAEVLSHRDPRESPSQLAPEARTLATDSGARVSFIASDGRVVADSSMEATIEGLDNHGDRPEIVEARARSTGIGIASRFSITLGIEMLYVAARVRHPAVAAVRLALPLTGVQDQLRTIWRSTLAALVLSLLGALAIAWVASALLVRRLERVASNATRYARGDLRVSKPDHGTDEIGTVARVLDETVRRMGERASELVRDRARMEAILSDMIEGVLVVDDDGRVQLANAAARRMLQLDADVAGRRYIECLHQAAVVGRLDAALAGETGDAAQRTTITESGRTIVARATPVAAAASGAVLVLHDLTDLRRADQVRQDFVANVSHELRTPLTAIRGYIEALGDEPVSDDDRRAFLAVIARHTGRMERMVGDLLRLARLESGQELPAHEPLSVAAVFTDVVADVRRQADHREQRITSRVDPMADLISGDAQQLHDALRNLVVNAIVHTPSGTTIELDARADGTQAILTVADGGPGIAEAELPRVFERFYRVDKGRSRNSGGTGLGLAIVKHLVECMGGSVSVANREGGGAVFTIRLPRGAAGT